jgi:hypothetical protein
MAHFSLRRSTKATSQRSIRRCGEAWEACDVEASAAYFRGDVAMRTFARAGFALSFAAATLLVGCGGPMTAPGAVQPAPAGKEDGAPLSSSGCLTTAEPTRQSPFFIPPLSVRRAEAMSGWTPADIRSAYNLPSSTRGKGQIVATVDICDNPGVASDLAEYRSTFGLPKAKFYKFNEYGEQGDYPPVNYVFGVETDAAVEMVSATCPHCTIYLIETNNLDETDVETAETTAVSLGAHIIHNGWDCTGSGCVERSYFDKQGITYLGSGNSLEDVYPADFDSAVAVGGTTLSQGGGGKRGWTEEVSEDWGGICDTSDPKPNWQHDQFCAGRAANDVSMVAWNLAAYDAYYGGWIRVSGSGIPEALLSGVFALAGNAEKQDGGRTFWERAHLKDLYRLKCEGECLNKRYSYASGWGSPDGIGAL